MPGRRGRVSSELRRRCSHLVDVSQCWERCYVAFLRPGRLLLTRSRRREGGVRRRRRRAGGRRSCRPGARGGGAGAAAATPAAAGLLPVLSGLEGTRGALCHAPQRQLSRPWPSVLPRSRLPQPPPRPWAARGRSAGRPSRVPAPRARVGGVAS